MRGLSQISVVTPAPWRGIFSGMRAEHRLPLKKVLNLINQNKAVEVKEEGEASMARHKYLPMALVACALTVGVFQGMAQSASPSTSQPAAAGAIPTNPVVNPATTPLKNCQNGKMRCVDSDTRWKVAMRNADRRAAMLRKTQGKGN